jgi:hypothetical protein
MKKDKLLLLLKQLLLAPLVISWVAKYNREYYEIPVNQTCRHAIGIPKLRGQNVFYHCQSCMKGKITKQRYVQNKHRKAIKRRKSTTLQPPNSTTQEIDDIYMPNAPPGQHFHMDFGFVCGTNFQEKNKEGQTITSIDGKNSYLLIVNRATRYMWVFLSASKQPPLQFI